MATLRPAGRTYVVAAPSDNKFNGVTRTYMFAAGKPVNHIVLGLSPLAAYDVAVSPANGGMRVSITMPVKANPVTTTAAGLLVFRTS